MQRIRIPETADELTPQWLTLALRRSSVLSENAAVRRITLGDPGRESSYAGFVTRMTVDYDRSGVNAPRSIIAKLPAPERTIRFLFRSIYRNEALFYRQLAGAVPISTPASYAALLNRKQTRSVLLLQDLAMFACVGDHDSGCTLDQARTALRALANLHSSWWNLPALSGTRWLSRYQVDSTKNWLIYAGAWTPFQLRLRHITPPATLRLFRTLWRHRRALQRMEANRPVALQHGDFRLANLAFTHDDVYVFDWQVVRTGLPLFDVAWFMLTSLTIEQRTAAEATLLRDYHVALVGAGVTGYSFEQMIGDYRLALLLTIPQIMVIGAFLRIDPAREATLGTLLRRFEAAREEHGLERTADG